MDVFHCPHHPEGNIPEYSIVCDCRKPKSGMFTSAMKKYEMDLGESIMIGDKISDIKAAIKAKLKVENCFLVETGHIIDISDRKKHQILKNIYSVATYMKSQ